MSEEREYTLNLNLGNNLTMLLLILVVLWAVGAFE